MLFVLFISIAGVNFFYAGSNAVVILLGLYPLALVFLAWHLKIEFAEILKRKIIIKPTFGAVISMLVFLCSVTYLVLSFNKMPNGQSMAITVALHVFEGAFFIGLTLGVFRNEFFSEDGVIKQLHPEN